MSEENVPTEQPQASEASRLSPSHVDPRRPSDHQGQAAEGSPAPLGLIWRVDRRQTFEALRRGRRRRAGPLTVSWVPGNPAEPPRVAYTIGRRVGSAVVRNRLRRRLRALVRDFGPRLRPGAYLIGVRPDAALLSFEDLRAMLVKVLTSIEDQ
jgi:ribonuclease P protein component